MPTWNCFEGRKIGMNIGEDRKFFHIELFPIKFMIQAGLVQL